MLFIHQIPPDPAYLRVKTGRRLARLGAVPLKNSVYVLPHSDSAIEDFQWVRRELVQGGGEATVVDAHLIMVSRTARSRRSFAAHATLSIRRPRARSESSRSAFRPSSTEQKRAAIAADLARHQRRLEEIAGVDFFGATGHGVAHGLLTGLVQRIASEETRATKATAPSLEPTRSASGSRVPASTSTASPAPG